ncbi:hypothetical protein RC1_3840 [Rhodospirillum centenum SW]|uniref:Uncharacterized protein n=1 Tax=Rhodospirillum centenum (strain ATCC 51521 / SW) TaxID=414684 RepID=B6IY08_RHOCS|nr:hypothetical protein RC1_3840 [Rhodospirillum centenum SW]
MPELSAFDHRAHAAIAVVGPWKSPALGPVPEREPPPAQGPAAAADQNR